MSATRKLAVSMSFPCGRIYKFPAYVNFTNTRGNSVLSLSIFLYPDMDTHSETLAGKPGDEAVYIIYIYTHTRGSHST